MDPNFRTLGRNAPLYHGDRYNLQQFSSPPDSPDAVYTHREPPGSNAHAYPTRLSYQEMSRVYSDSPSSQRGLLDQGIRADQARTQFSGFRTRSYNHAPSPQHEQPEPSNFDTRFNRAETPETHHRTQYDWIPHTPSAEESASGSNTSSTLKTTRNGFGWKLRPVSELPDRFRGVFKFGVFNAVQSACFDQVLHSDENLVISAPTGSGKTVVFELGMIRLLTQTADDARSAKSVYVAPTKALCAEKYNEWTAKFGGLGIKCCELTGDTLLLGKGVWGDAKSSHIIVTTAEKWDSLTRNWADHTGILSRVKLFLVDEVHILNESRGSTLEVIVSRMKARGFGTRFLLISATVPNVEDVALWIGSRDGIDQPARMFQFGEEFRPCKLTKFVYGVEKPKGQNDFAYARILDMRLFPVIQQHSTNKPILIFCPTRKGTLDAAKQLAKDYEQAMQAKKNVPWPPPMRIHQNFHDKDLAVLASAGIAVHHAGLSADDRRSVEELFLQKSLRVLVATSTLAVGVNLPAQMVVIKGVKLYQNGEMKEYSDLDIMQMMGRAGRPQFDDEGVAIILCEPELEYKYRALAQGNTTLESSLHQNLPEHLNSEIGLGTISTVESAKDWLQHSFLFRRIQKNPHHYDIGKNDNQSWEEKVDEIVMKSILSLRDTQLIEYTEKDGKLASTEYGDVMSKLYIRQSTMRAILDLPVTASMREILELVSTCEEVSNLKLRNGEKQTYEKIRRHNDIRFPPKKAVTTGDKVLLLIQAILAGLPLSSPELKPAEGQPYLEAISVFRHATRIVTAVGEVSVINRSGATLKHALELARCLNAKAWEDRPLVLRQIEHIGEKSVKVLAENGITSIQKLLQTSPLRIEELLNRRSPFGFEVLAAANEFPKYFLDIKELGVLRSRENSPVEVEFVVRCGLTLDDSVPQRVKKPKWGKPAMTTLLVVTSDMNFIDFRRIATKALGKEKKELTLTAQLTKPSQLINVYIASDNIAGVTVVRSLAPNVPPNHYPTLETRPLTSIEMDLQGLEDVPDFWDMDMDDDEEIMDSHVVDSVKHHDDRSSKTQSHPNPPVIEQVERDQRKRPDGKYECNHPCKDKLKCRHYCCQEGLLEPPRTTKKRQQATTHRSDAKLVQPSRTSITSQGEQERKSNKLVNTQERVNTAQNPRLAGPRLRPADHLNKSRGTKTTPNFDVQLTTLKRSRSPIPGPSMDDSWDELPLISDGWRKNDSVSATDHATPSPKRKRTSIGTRLLEPQLSSKKAISHSKFRPSTQFFKERLFLRGSDDEETAERKCASRDATPAFDESYPGAVPDSIADQPSVSGWSAVQSTSSQWSGDDTSTRRTLLFDGVGVTTPERTLSTNATRDAYALSPSRITGFMRRSSPYSKGHSTNDDATANPQGLTSESFERASLPTSSIDSQSVYPSDTVGDALAEFERWIESGAVEIIPD